MASITFIKTDTANGNVAVSGTDTSSRTIPATRITGSGTVKLQVLAGTASDTLGNFADDSALCATIISFKFRIDFK
ncbi:MAG: hypothetical protein HQM10_24440 [Candidatus Riflebacteria bacterium]|nr:hypothetical protein [Candidatus Riflebacteria bacterium]